MILNKNKRKLPKAITSAVLTAVFFIISICPVFAEFKPSNIESDYMKTIVDVIVGKYRFDADEIEIYRNIMDYALSEHPELLEGMLSVAAKNLDKHSGYYTREDLESFGQFIDREYVGIGVSVERIMGYVALTSISPGGPAEESGLLAEDRILKIDGIDATNFSINEAAAKIRGESGTFVNLTVLRGNKELDYKVERRTVSVSSCNYEIVEDGIGYISIAQFNSSTPVEVGEALSFFGQKGIKKLIIDVRDNPGGELGSVIKTLSYFVPADKLLLAIDYKAEGYDIKIKSQADFKESDKEIVVLVNENSASAAEVFTGAIMDNDVGVSVGRLTYGKGSVQEFLGLLNIPGHEIGDIKLSVAEYTLPGGESINNKGIKPDYNVKNRYTELDKSGLSPLLYEKKYTLGDSGDGVLAIKQRLDLLGYFVGEVNSTFDSETAVAISTFQKQSELHPYGVADLTTQMYLDAAVVNAEVLVDNQFLKAVELLGGKTKDKEQ